MRKLLILLLLLTLTVQPVSISADSTGDALSKDVYLIEALGIADGISELQEEAISRAEFLSWVLKMARLEISAVKEKPLFADVTMGHAYSGEIQTAFEHGIITGTGSGSFNPDDYITMDDAAIMLINALGYRLDNDNLYQKLTRSLGLLDNFTYGRPDVLTRRNAVVMLYNALNAPEINITGSDLKVDLTEGKTFLQKKWEVYSVKGVADTTGTASASQRSAVPGRAYIDDVLYYTEAFSIDSMLGCEVKAFYRDEDDEKSIVYAYPTNKNRIVNIIKEELDRFSNNVFSFKTGSKKITYKISSLTNVIWNNRILNGSEFDEKLNSKAAEFTFIDNNSDNVYDYVIVKEAKVYVPTVVDSDRMVLGGENMEDIEIEDYISYSIKDIDGENVDFADIKSTYAVLVYDSGDINTCLELVVIKNTVSAEVTAVDMTEGKLTVFGGEEYKVAANSAYPVSKFEMNASYSVYLDKSNRIVYAKLEKRKGFEPIYLIRTMKDEDEQVIMRALSAEGEIAKFNVAEKVKIRYSDGENEYAPEETAYTAFCDVGGRTSRQLLLVKFNSKNEINTIYTVSSNPNMTFYDPHPDDHNAYRWLATQYSLENLIQLKAGTKIFFVPNPSLDNIDDEFYYVGDVGTLRHDTAYQSSSWYPDTGYGFKPVTMQPGALESDYMVVECPENKTFSSGAACYGIVTKVKEVYSEEYEDICRQVTVLNMAGVEQVFYYFPETETPVAERGDIVKINYSSSKIYDRDIDMYYDYSKDSWTWYTDYDNTIGWRYYAPFRVTKGTVKQTENGIAKCETLSTGTSYQNEFLKYNTSKIIKFDGTSYTVMDGNNLKTGTEFYAMLSGGVIKMLVLYEDLPR